MPDIRNDDIDIHNRDTLEEEKKTTINQGPACDRTESEVKKEWQRKSSCDEGGRCAVVFILQDDLRMYAPPGCADTKLGKRAISRDPKMPKTRASTIGERVMTVVAFDSVMMQNLLSVAAETILARERS